MQAQTTFIASPDDLQRMLQEAMAPVCNRLRELEVAAGLRKHAYTVAEVAEQIGYHPNTVLEFIHVGRKAQNGKQVRLKAREISKSVYRILPKDLDDWLAHF